VCKIRNPDNPALEDSSLKTTRLAFEQIKASSMKQADLRDMFGETSRSVCTSTIVLSADPDSYSILFRYYDSRKHRRGT